MTHEQLIQKMMAAPEVKAEYERLNREELALLDEMLAARGAAGLTQAEVAERTGNQSSSMRPA